MFLKRFFFKKKVLVKILAKTDGQRYPIGADISGRGNKKKVPRRKRKIFSTGRKQMMTKMRSRGLRTIQDNRRPTGDKENNTILVAENETSPRDFCRAIYLLFKKSGPIRELLLLETPIRISDRQRQLLPISSVRHVPPIYGMIKELLLFLNFPDVEKNVLIGSSL